jgi:predicted Rossmann fold nucleotide-binding protein DprA/Smf involved in DNA uptake
MKTNAGRAPASMTAEQWAWLDGVLRHAVGKHAAPVRRIVAKARAKAESTVSLRLQPREKSVSARVVPDLVLHGPSRVQDVARRLGSNTNTVSAALSYQKSQGRVSHVSRVWSVATAPVRLVGAR